MTFLHLGLLKFLFLDDFLYKLEISQFVLDFIFCFQCDLSSEDVCKEVECGKGTCKPSKNSTFLFECECNPGWKQSPSSHDEGSLKFLPCIVPNCKNYELSLSLSLKKKICIQYYFVVLCLI